MINSCGFVGDAVAVDRTIFVIPHLRLRITGQITIVAVFFALMQAQGWQF